MAPNAREERIVIAGAGVAGLEALLALRRLLGESANVVVIAPNREFVYRALAVAEPFGREVAGPWDLGELIAAAGGAFSQAAVVKVDAGAKRVVTESGNEFGYGQLLLAPGTTHREVLPGALAYRGPRDNARISDLLDELAAGVVSSITYAVPTAVHWALPLYELALQTAAWARARGLDAQLTIVTHESRPLGAFGRGASASVQELLADRGIALRLNAPPAIVQGRELALMNGNRMATDRVVTLPALEADAIDGVPQGPHGLIDTDPFMRVESLPDVFAAGDATWFPIKQGGIAAQQADTAARTIASVLDPAIKPQPFRPILRGALLTGGAPRYLRSQISRPEVSDEAAVPLWSPPSKVAARYLAPFLSAFSDSRNQPMPPLEDLPLLEGEEQERSEADHAEIVELALSSAEADAAAGDYRTALRWLDTAEALEMTLAPEYARKRANWVEQDRQRRGR
jgi:sulfide:quinone oxidoreductase